MGRSRVGAKNGGIGSRGRGISRSHFCPPDLCVLPDLPITRQSPLYQSFLSLAEEAFFSLSSVRGKDAFSGRAFLSRHSSGVLRVRKGENWVCERWIQRFGWAPNAGVYYEKRKWMAGPFDRIELRFFLSTSARRKRERHKNKKGAATACFPPSQFSHAIVFPTERPISLFPSFMSDLGSPAR